MFQFVDSANKPLAAVNGVLHPLIHWSLPTALGGVRKWALGHRSFTIGTDVYEANHVAGGLVTPTLGDLPNINEGWQFDLADKDGAWATRLKDFAGGTKAVLLAKLVVGATESANAMTVAVGWVHTVTPIESVDEGRIVRVVLRNEFVTEQRDASLPMTHDTERALDATSNSLKYTNRSATLSWGGRQGTRRNT